MEDRDFKSLIDTYKQMRLQLAVRDDDDKRVDDRYKSLEQKARDVMMGITSPDKYDSNEPRDDSNKKHIKAQQKLKVIDAV